MKHFVPLGFLACVDPLAPADTTPAARYGSTMEPPETPAAKRRRLRLISFAELIGVLAVAISAASYWDAHRDRAVAARPVAVARAPLLLTATADDAGGVLRLRPAGPEVIQTQSLRFPAAVRADAVETTGNARIEAAWIESGLRATVPGDADTHPPRLPVGIVTVFADGGVTHTDAAVYDIGYTMHDRLLRGRAVELEGITLVRRVPAAALPAALAARWAKVSPPAK